MTVENKSEIRLCGMLGFAMRAGKVIIGTELVCSAMAKGGKDAPRLVLVARGASDGPKKKLSTKAERFSGVTMTKSGFVPSSVGLVAGSEDP